MSPVRSASTTVLGLLLLVAPVVSAQVSGRAPTVPRGEKTSAIPSKTELPLKYVGKPTVEAITSADLMTRLYIFADDSMMGREVGTKYHTMATDYIAREVRARGDQQIFHPVVEDVIGKIRSAGARAHRADAEQGQREGDQA